MPCQSDYLSATSKEVTLSRLYLLVDEIRTGIQPDVRSSAWSGYDKRVYNKGLQEEKADQLAQELCAFCSSYDISGCSLELQVWWRDHQKADRIRKDQERLEVETENIRFRALSKLSDKEKKALGLKK